MKKYLVLISLSVLVVALQAQDIKVPLAVQDAFAKLYPDISEVKWGKEGANEFEAEFTRDSTRTSVVFNKDGELEETETAIRINDLPSTVAPYVSKNYPGYKISEAAKIVDDKGVVTYEAEISKETTKKDLMFDKDGNHLEKKMDKDKEKGDEDKE